MTVLLVEEVWIDGAGRAVPAGHPEAIKRLGMPGQRVRDRDARDLGVRNGLAVERGEAIADADEGLCEPEADHDDPDPE